MLTQDQEKHINDLDEDFRPLVKEIESSIATTKNHYGRYMALFGSLCKGEKKIGIVIDLALQRAGANVTGVNDAFSLSF